MERVTVTGIVLSETNYSETSKILNILTSEYGLISAISKGSRNIKSKLRGVSMRFVYAKFTINYKENGLSTLMEASVINSLKYIMTDLTKMNYSLYVLDLVKNILKDNNKISLFEPTIHTLLKINGGFDPAIITNILEIQLLSFLGVEPVLNECIKCGNEDDLITFSNSESGMICQNCYIDEYLFNNNTIKLIRLFLNIDISKVDKLNITNKDVRAELEAFIKDYYQTYTGVYLKNKEKFNITN